jgi:hypothetical protein
MTEEENSNDNREKKIIEDYERNLPKIWGNSRKREAEIEKKYMEELQIKLLLLLRTSLSAPSYLTWFEESLSIFALNIIDNSITICMKTRLQKEWIEQRYEKLLIKSLKEITGIDYILNYTSSEESVENSNYQPQTKTSSFDFLFTGEYKDHIDSDELSEQTKLLNEKILENQNHTNELIEQYFSDKTVETSGTLEERIVALQGKVSQIREMQLEQNKLIDHLAVLVTRLEARIEVNPINKRVAFQQMSEDEKIETIDMLKDE